MRLPKTIRLACILLAASAGLWAQDSFTPLEQQVVSIETPGLFDRSSAFQVDFSLLKPTEFCFPLPVGKGETQENYNLSITTKSGDAVKAMFDGTVRMSRHHPQFGNIVILRHNNGLETVYGGNAQNLVQVGQQVKAGQTIAIVGMVGGRGVCDVAVMVNGARINPNILLAVKSHRLLQQTLQFTKLAKGVDVQVVERDPWQDEQLALEQAEAARKIDPFKGGTTFTLDLSQLASQPWAYPLPGGKVISPFGARGGRRHTGTDIKTRPNDDILAAFDGVVIMSQRYSAYGNCIILKHANGLETLYSHNSKNLVRVGQVVKAGEKIALTGRTGRATTEHLHFECRLAGAPFNSALLFNHQTHQLGRWKLQCVKRGKAVTVSKK